MSMLQKTQSSAVPSYQSGWYWASDRFQAKAVVADADRYKIVSPAIMQANVGTSSLTNITAQTLDLSLDATWDHGTNLNHTTAIGTWQAGHEYHVGDWVRPTAAWLEDGANNASTAYATPALWFGNWVGPSTIYHSQTGETTFPNYYESASYLFSSATSLNQLPASQGAGVGWEFPAASLPLSMDVKLTTPIVVNKYAVYASRSGSLLPTGWQLQGTNNPNAVAGDAENANGWTTIHAVSNPSLSSVTVNSNTYQWTNYLTVSNSIAYQYYRLRITSGSVAWLQVGQLKLIKQPLLVYRCTIAGTSHASTHPTMPITELATVTESGSTLQWTAYLDNTVASNRAGQDFYVFACTPTSGSVPKLIVSKNSTYPHNYDATNSRKLGGFHCLCEPVGTISGHTLTGYVKGDILPASVWDLRWKSGAISPSTQVYDPARQIWTAIYHPSGTMSAPVIAYGGTILANVDSGSVNVGWNNAVDAAASLGMRLARDSEFQSVASGSNERTVIYGAAIPATVVGAVDSAGVRMISNIGVEGACGQLSTWLDEQGYRFDGAASHTHAVTVNGDAQTNVVSGNASVAIDPAFGWQALSGSKGSVYKQGTYGSIKLCGGGSATITTATNAGSRERDLSNWQWNNAATITFRPVAHHIVKEYA
jgi:hypothetical protein